MKAQSKSFLGGATVVLAAVVIAVVVALINPSVPSGSQPGSTEALNAGVRPATAPTPTAQTALGLEGSESAAAARGAGRESSAGGPWRVAAREASGGTGLAGGAATGEGALGLLFGRHWRDAGNPPELVRFAEWVDRYQAARTPAERAVLEVEGVALAQERRAVLRSMIAADPERALAVSLPYGVRAGLPASVAGELEHSVSGRGALAVLGALPEPGREAQVTPVIRTATVGGEEYDAHVYGRRLGEPTRWDVPLNGIVVDRRMAVSVNPVRLMGVDEAAARLGVPAAAVGAADPVCAVSGESALVHQTPQAAEVGGQVVRLCGVGHAEDLNAQYVRAEAAGGGPGGDGVQASAYTEGTKRLIVIRVDFSDLAGDPFPTNNGTTLISGLNDFFMDNSHGRSGFYLHGSGSDVTATFRMPRTAAYYGGTNAYTQLRSDARSAATAAGWNLSSYDFDLICFGAVPGWGWAGLGYVGAPGVWLRSYFTTGVAGHELGHNYGLNHANYWDTGGASVIGTGSSVEYGDSFDTMGAASGGANHFNARYKSYLNWLTAAEVQTVTNSGVYRIQAHDDDASSGVQALKIARNSNTNFWVEFRQQFTGNKWMMSGAGLRWAGNGNQRSDLLDTTPGSANGKNDSPLVLGRTFSDTASGIHITTLRKAGTTPEALDVAVYLGAFPTNVAPSVAVAAGATSVAVGATATFTATAADANGDTLAYYWDFGDGNFGTNGSLASKSWASAGEYLVQCTVTDMRGGTARDSVVVTVGAPTSYRISGRVLNGGLPVAGARVSVSSTRMAYTDTDGTYALVGLPASSYTVSVSLDGYSFSASGFANPVAVGPSATGIDFSAAASFVAVALTSPTNGATYAAPSSLDLTASASPSSGRSLTRVEFYRSTTKLGEDTTAPYSLTWSSPTAGTHLLTAVATDSAGLVATSSPVTVVVSAVASPVISTQPQNLTLAAGAGGSLTVVAAGANPMVYQWYRDGAAVSGLTNASVTFAAATPADEGSYRVIITNPSGAATSSVAVVTVNCTPTLSPASVSHGPSGGSGSLTVAVDGSCDWSVTGVPSWITLTSASSGSGSGTVTYSVAAHTGTSTRTATLSVGGASFAVSQTAPDLTAPTVAFSSPAAGTVTSDATLAVSGTASDNVGVVSVQYRVGTNDWVTATGTTSWSAVMSLAAGTNVVSVRSADAAGNTSTVAQRSFVQVTSGTLTVTVHGQGSVKGATNGQRLQVGKAYTLTAVAASGYVFSNWTGSISARATRLDFVMTSNLQVAAHFVPNPFTARKGVYNGLFYETNEVRAERAGAFTLAMTDKGAYSASLMTRGWKLKGKGLFDLEGRATNRVLAPDGTTYVVTWAVALDGSDMMTGEVVNDSDGWSAALTGDRLVYHPGLNPAPQAGRYSFVILGNPSQAEAPGGDGAGVVNVDAKGGANVAGYLADQTKFVARAPLSGSGQWPVYAALSGGRGAILGWVTFRDEASTDLDGVLSWTRPAGAGVMYPDGFVSEAAMVGSRFTPVTAGGAPVLDLTNPEVSFEGGNLAQAFTNVVSVAGATVSNLGTNAMTFKVSASTGMFSGSAAVPGGAGVLPFRGAVLQKAGWASGFYTGTNQTGRVLLSERP